MEYLAKLREIFKQPDLYQAHREAKPVLVAAAKDKEFFFEVIRKNLSDPAYLDRVRHYPTLSFPIEDNETFTVVGNVFLPLPDGNTNISFQSIHHHGQLLLSTVSAFGPGYESMLFKAGYSVDPETAVTDMQLEKVYRNNLHNIEFVDAFVPHVVFYPTSPSITFALWSKSKHESLAKMKKNPVLQKVKKPLKALLGATGLNGVAGINKIEYNDFYAENGRVVAMRDRIGYPEGTNENWLQNLFSVVQQYGFNDQYFLEKLKSDCAVRNQNAPIQWIDKLLSGEEIPLEFEPSHLNIDKVNLTKQSILDVYPTFQTANT